MQMEPQHLKFPTQQEGEVEQRLCWQVELPVAQGAVLHYQYAVVDGMGRALTTESERRLIRIPESATAGEIGACPHLPLSLLVRGHGCPP